MESAETIVGKRVVIGITGIHRETDRRRQVQVQGTVIEADLTAWIAIRTEPIGPDFLLPPAFAYFYPARPGTYRARSTGAVFANPDLDTQWSVVLEEEADLDAGDWVAVWKANGIWSPIEKPPPEAPPI